MIDSGTAFKQDFAEQELVVQSRQWFLLILRASKIAGTGQTCVFGSHFLLAVLRRFSKVLEDIHLCGGGPPDQSGVVLQTGGFASHMWVGGTYNGDLWYFDITADQFGLPEVVCAPAADLKSVFVADPRELTDLSLSEIHLDDLLKAMAG